MPAWLKKLLDKWLKKKPPVPPPVEPPIGSVPEAVLQAHNVARAKDGRQALVLSVLLNIAAQKQSQHQADRNRIGHDGENDSTPWDRIEAAGYRYSSASENVAAGQRNAQEAVDDWLSSPGHRANVLGNWSEAGFGMAQGSSGTKYWTAVYANPMSRAMEAIRAARFLGAAGQGRIVQ